MRIGGEFELEPGDFRAPPLPPERWPAPPSPHGNWVDTGRSALNVIANRIRAGGRASGTVHLPAYTCHSAVSPFGAAGFSVKFHGGLPFDAELAVPDLRPGDIFVVTDYFGLANEAARRVARRARADGVIVVEDRVQASLGTTPPLEGDFLVTSLRKFLAVPDGAFLGAREPFVPVTAAPDEASVTRRLAAKLMRAADLPPDCFLPLIEAGEEALPPDRPRCPSEATAMILGTLDLAAIRARRRANWVVLDAELAQRAPETTLSRPMPAPRDGEVPLGYPILVDAAQRDRLRAHLSRRGIFCPIHWALDHLPEGGWSRERDAAARTLTLVVDQRYGATEMRHTVDAITDFFEKSKT